MIIRGGSARSQWCHEDIQPFPKLASFKCNVAESLEIHMSREMNLPHLTLFSCYRVICHLRSEQFTRLSELISIYGSGPDLPPTARITLSSIDLRMVIRSKNDALRTLSACQHVCTILRFQVPTAVTCHSVNRFSELRVFSSLTSTDRGSVIPHVYTETCIYMNLSSSQMCRWVFICVDDKRLITNHPKKP